MTENEFIDQLKSHHASAYGKLLDDFQQKVFATCISFIPNKEDAEDVAQEVFVEVFKSINKFKGNSGWRKKKSRRRKKTIPRPNQKVKIKSKEAHKKRNQNLMPRKVNLKIN